MDKILIFSDAGFPDYHEVKGTDDNCVICGREKLAECLDAGSDVFINMHGSYFPQEACEALFGFLERGGGYINIGGVPMLYVIGSGSGAIAQNAYFRRMNIHAFYESDCSSVIRVGTADGSVNVNALAAEIDTGSAKSLVWNPTKNKYQKDEWGSSGSMDAVVTSMLNGYDAEGNAVVSYGVIVNNYDGRYRGGRWAIIPSVLTGDSVRFKDLAPLAGYIGHRQRKVRLNTSFASYFAGEVPSVEVIIEQSENPVSWEGILACSKNGNVVNEYGIKINDGCDSRIERTVVLGEMHEAGRYELKLVICSADKETVTLTQGFYIYDKGRLEGCMKLTYGPDYFEFDGKIKPVIGTTYMSDEVSRNFLLYPNPSHWYRDMSRMKGKGINWVRTGIWCNWRRYMWDSGQMDERILRAFDAFLQAAAENDMHVTFTLFSFVPENWEGSNPYLDERSLRAQESFIRSLALRCRGFGFVDWDLINEPYVFDHPSTRPSPDDVYENSCFAGFLSEKYGDIDKMCHCLDLDRTKIKKFSDVRVPQKKDMNLTYFDSGSGRNGSLWREYHLFSVWVLRKWITRMRAVIKSISPSQAVCVGQDEAIMTHRPTPLLFGNCVDYTCQHSWWHNDCIPFCLKSSKTPGRPLLLQEAGVMYNESADGWPRRNEAEQALLLQKKFIYSFACGGAGCIHWVWNSNYMLDSANESHIGDVRNDGTDKPEMAFYTYMRDFFGTAGKYMSSIRNTPRIAVIYPFSNDFSNRPYASEACRKLTYILCYVLRYDFYFVSEYEIPSLAIFRPEIIIVPSAHQFDAGSFGELMRTAKTVGASVIYTGPIDMDQYGKKYAVDAMPDTTVRPVRRNESLRVGNRSFDFIFSGNTYETAYADVFAGGGIYRKISYGSYTVYHVGIPIEISDSISSIAEFYRYLFKSCGYKNDISVEGTDREGLYVNKTAWDEADLYCFVNELPSDARIYIADNVRGCRYRLEAQADGAGMFLADHDGRILAAYHGTKAFSE